MKNFLSGILASTVGCFLLVLSGCGEPGIGAVPVDGVVKVDGQPMAGVNVMFHPDGSGRAAAGISDAQGVFKLTTQIANDGALPGKYKISVIKHENPEDDIPKTADPNDSKSMDAIYSKLDTRKKVKSKSLIHSQYENPNGSGLTAEVKASGTNHFEFDVKGAGKK